MTKFPTIGPANWLQRASIVLPASIHIIGLCLSLSINHGLTGSESPDSAVNHNTNQGGRGQAAAELKMDKFKQRLGGAEKLLLKKLKSLKVEAAKC